MVTPRTVTPVTPRLRQSRLRHMVMLHTELRHSRHSWHHSVTWRLNYFLNYLLTYSLTHLLIYLITRNRHTTTQNITLTQHTQTQTHTHRQTAPRHTHTDGRNQLHHPTLACSYIYIHYLLTHLLTYLLNYLLTWNWHTTMVGVAWRNIIK